MPESTSAYDLFLKFQRQYRHLELVPVTVRDIDAGEVRVFFRPRLKGSAVLIHPSHYRGERHQGNFIAFDLRRGGVGFDSRFDVTNQSSLQEQLTVAAGKAVLDGPLSSPLSVSVTNLDVLRAVLEGRGYQLPLSLTWQEGGDHRGLYVPNPLFAESWQFFFPENSPECSAIETAIELRKAQAVLSDVRSVITTQDDLTSQIEELSCRLSTTLAGIPAYSAP